MPRTPLVIVGIPTYQRCELLGRAIDSVLDQDYPSIELHISDDASTDGTADLCSDYVARHPNVRYFRRPSNGGPTSNFESLRSSGLGDYFLFLGDDDWIDPKYVSACVAALESNPGAALAAGRSWYHRGENATIEPESINVEGNDGPARVLEFYRTVGAAGLFYGVVPAAVNNRAPEIRNVMGNDLLHLAGLAFLGPLRTLESVSVHRQADGTSVSLANVAATLGLGWFQAQAPQLAFAYWVMQDIAWKSPLYAELGRVRRLRLGLHAGWIAFWRFVPKAAVKFGRLTLTRLHKRALSLRSS
jgi:glycosyltransferase involved in cell wall biosynthesis